MNRQHKHNSIPPNFVCTNFNAMKLEENLRIFEHVRKQYAALGINLSSNQWTHKYPLNGRVLFGLLLFGCVIVSHFVYIFYVANSFMDYMVGICSLSGCLMIFVCFANAIFKRTSLFESIDNIGKLIASRLKYPESKALFSKTNQQVERLSEFIFMLTVKLTPQLVILPKFIVSFGNYFFTDSRSDSFQLPIPLW